MNAVIYARFSCDKQKEESIEGQERVCRSFAAQQSIDIIGIYADRAQTGRNDNRTEFQRMLKDSAKKRFEAVIVYKIDRFGRNREEIAINKVKLRKNGVRVLYAQEHIPEGPEGIILESVLEGMAEYYSAELAQKIKRGMHDTALKCKYTGSYMPFGYDVDPITRQYIINEKTAPLVRDIFSRRANGEAIVSIIESLKSRGIKTYSGKDFTHNVIAKMLANKKYIGMYSYADVVVENGVPAIVEREVFDTVQRMINKNKQIRGNSGAKVNYLLTAKAVCAKCGGSFVGDSGANNKGNIYNYYKCVNRKRKKACDMISYGKEELETIVVKATVENVLKDDIIAMIADKIIAVQAEERAKDELAHLYEARLRDVEKSIANILKAIEQGIITPSTSERLKELEDQKANLSDELYAAQHKHISLTKGQIVYWLKQFQDGDLNDEVFREKIIDLLIRKVIVGEKEITIVYNYCSDGYSDSFELVTPGRIELPIQA